MDPPTPTPAPPTATPRPQWIAFETERGEAGDYEIFVVAPDGSRLANATNMWADDVAPVWSPDGRSFAFVSYRDTLAGKWSLGPGSIYRQGFDPLSGAPTGGAVRVTDDGGNDGWPTWAPGGQRIAFESDRSGNWDIWVINVDGSGLTNLTQSPDDDERFPAWSPNGQRMAFTSKRSGNWDVWSFSVDEALQGGGAQPVNLTNAPARDRYAMWSPDSRRIAFNTNRDGNQEIYVMNADGSNPTNASNAPDSVEGLADWSPDGRRLVLYSDQSGNKDLFVVELASGRWNNITQHPASDEFCTWSP
jgi:Tol biopolymer transport system component